MPTLTRDHRFFGLDLRHLAHDLGAAGQRMRRWPVFAWLTPEYPVRLAHADGGESFWLASETLRPAAPNEARRARFTAIQLPEDLVLRRSLPVPALLSEAQAADAIALDIASASPFAAADTVWGHALLSADGAPQRRIEAALASRRQVNQALDSSAAPAGAGDRKNIELWAWSGHGTPIVMRGFGENERAVEVRRGRRRRLALLALAALLLAAIAITPTAQLRLRALQAVAAFDSLNQRAAPLVAKREALVHSADRLAALRTLLDDRVDALRVLDVVTQALPDDTWLQGMQLDGRKVVISGQTGNAAALMQAIGNRAGLRDVRAPTPAYRQPGAPKESFTIEFALDPKALGPSGAGAPDANPASAGAERALLANGAPALLRP